MKGIQLPGGWVVGDMIGAGRSRSVGYHVTGPAGEKAFLKALDCFRAYEAKDTLAAMDEIISSIRHERDLVKMCAKDRMSRVVRGLDYGEIKLAKNEHAVWYLIFELAQGDVRHELAKIDPDEQVWRLRTLHQAAVGLAQMHRRGLCHQNMKPSHLLAVPEQGVKIGDLSTTSMEGLPVPLFDADNPGDPIYAPPESLYGFRLAGDLEHQRARDMYLFGSLIPFLYLEITTTTALLAHLDGPWHPRETEASFEETLPYLNEAFDGVVQELEESEAPAILIASFRELCQPDPRRRGHPRAHAETHGSSYSLERYVSRLALALWHAEGQSGYGRHAA
jgi:serine/threonine protein kinase